MPATGQRIARAVFRACEIPGARAPFDRLSLKIHYPALPDESEEQRSAGVVAADTEGKPYPVVIVLPGINVGPEAYAWLAKPLAVQGYIVVTFTMIAEEMPGYVSLTPGLDLSAITPDSYGTRPSATAIAPILACLNEANKAGVLDGCINTNEVLLVGHSAGGSVALFNASADWFPGVRGAVAYGAHSGASTALGFAEGTILELPSDQPLLLIGGTRDGVIAGSASRYGESVGDSLGRMRQTFLNGVTAGRKDCYLAEINGANHFSFAYPEDDSTGRAFLDMPEEADGETLRQLFAEMIIAFADNAVGREATELMSFAEHDLVSGMRCR